MGKKNVLVLMSDQHTPDVMGCYGNQRALTPHLDALALRSVVFENAYTPSPICVPARAALATGRYPHDTGNWDNAAPYTGHEATSWATRLEDSGIPVRTFGKLHYRNTNDPTGFKRQHMPLHVKDGVGDLTQLLRSEQPPTPGLRQILEQAGPGESDYTRYDRKVAVAASEWIEQQQYNSQPWCAVVSLVSPHYPLIAPQEFYDKFVDQVLPPAPGEDVANWDRHPAPSEYRTKCNMDEPLRPKTMQRAREAYYGLVAFMDAQMGLVLEALERTNQTKDTTVIYLSDHGESLGAHGFWFKSTLHETALRVPMLFSDPHHDLIGRCHTPVNLTDIYPTMLQQYGIELSAIDNGIRGLSLSDLARKPENPDRPIFSEYHAVHSSSASLALRVGRWKLHHHVGQPSRLFDLEADRQELRDLAALPESGSILDWMECALRNVVDPLVLDETVKHDQVARIEAAGGREAVLASRFSDPYTPVPTTG